MFKRREPLTKLQLLKEMFWPTMGWKRSAIFIKHRVLRLSDSPFKIACGLATGACISFSPLLGTHFIQAGLIAYFIRANILASLIGTFMGNPWTFPFIWYFSYALGTGIFAMFGIDRMAAMPDVMTISIMWNLLTTQPLSLFVPWMVGGYILSVVTWPLYALVFYILVKTGKKARRIAKRKRMKQKLERNFKKAEDERV